MPGGFAMRRGPAAFPAEQRIGINGGLPEAPMSGAAGSTAAPENPGTMEKTCGKYLIVRHLLIN